MPAPMRRRRSPRPCGSMSGEALPPGADAVAPLDAVAVRDGVAQALAPVAPGEGVLPRGGDAGARRHPARRAGASAACSSRCLRPPASTGVRVRVPRLRLARARAGRDPHDRCRRRFIAGAIGAAGGRRGCCGRGATVERAARSRAPTRSSPSAAPAADATTRACARWRGRPGRGARHRASCPGRPAAFGMVGRGRCCCCPAGSMPRWRSGSCSAAACWRGCRQRREPPRLRTAMLTHKVTSARARRGRAGALRERAAAPPHSLGLCAAFGAGAGQRLDSGAGRERRISGGRARS